MPRNDDPTGFPSGACPDSDHIAGERARLKSASQRHFAEGGPKVPAAPPKEAQRTGSPAPGKQMPPNLVDEDQL